VLFAGSKAQFEEGGERADFPQFRTSAPLSRTPLQAHSMSLAIRSVKTLSGETMLAYLAVTLAITDDLDSGLRLAH
jgi:hypothetical protein